MTALITSADYPSVRAVLDASIDDEVLADSYIELPIFVDTAEAEVRARVKDADTLTDTAALHVHNAVIYWTAALLCPFLPDLTLETFGDYNYRRRPMNWQDRATYLLGRALAEIDLANGDTTQSVNQPTAFAKASGTRGF